MKKRVIPTIPEVFSLRGNDYSQFVVRGGASGMIRQTWSTMGNRLRNAAAEVGRNGQKKAA